MAGGWQKDRSEALPGVVWWQEVSCCGKDAHFVAPAGPRMPSGNCLSELAPVASSLEVISVAFAFASGCRAATAASAQADSVGRSVLFFQDVALLGPDTVSFSAVLALRWGRRRPGPDAVLRRGRHGSGGLASVWATLSPSAGLLRPALLPVLSLQVHRRRACLCGLSSLWLLCLPLAGRKGISPLAPS